MTLGQSGEAASGLQTSSQVSRILCWEGTSSMRGRRGAWLPWYAGPAPCTLQALGLRVQGWGGAPGIAPCHSRGLEPGGHGWGRAGVQGGWQHRARTWGVAPSRQTPRRSAGAALSSPEYEGLAPRAGPAANAGHAHSGPDGPAALRGCPRARPGWTAACSLHRGQTSAAATLQIRGTACMHVWEAAQSRSCRPPASQHAASFPGGQVQGAYLGGGRRRRRLQPAAACAAPAACRCLRTCGSVR